MRLINEELDKRKSERKKAKEHLYIVHGNLFIAHVAFRLMPADLIKDFGSLTEDESKIIRKTTLRVLDGIISSINTLLPDVYAGNLFKNLKKCRDLLELSISHLSKVSK